VTDTKVEKNHTNMCPEIEKYNTVQQVIENGKRNVLHRPAV